VEKMAAKTILALFLAVTLIFFVFAANPDPSGPTEPNPDGANQTDPNHPNPNPDNVPVNQTEPPKQPVNQTEPPKQPVNLTEPPKQPSKQDPSTKGPSVDDDIQQKLKWVKIGYLSAAILLGLVWCSFGYRLIKPVLFVCGFVLAYFVAFNILISHVPITTLKPWMDMAIAAGAGLLGGIILVLLFRVGVFFMGFIFGAVIASLVVAFSPLNGILLKSVNGDVSIWVFAAVIVGLGILVGIVAVLLTRPIFILVTACNGSYMVMASIDELAGFHRLRVMTKIFAGQTAPLQALSYQSYDVYVVFGGLILLALVGIIIQARFTARGWHHDPAVLNRKPKGQDDIPLLEP
jgi:hypothetical protein